MWYSELLRFEGFWLHWCVYGCQINPPLLSICIAQCFLHDVNYGPIVIQYSAVRFRSKSLLIFLCQSVTCQETTFAYLDEGVEYVDTALDYVNVNKETRWLYHYSDSDVIEPIHCASRCWCLLEWQTEPAWLTRACATRPEDVSLVSDSDYFIVLIIPWMNKLLDNCLQLLSTSRQFESRRYHYLVFSPSLL